jgi:hypothetical protein
MKKIKKLTPEILKELQRIQNSIPKELTDALVIRVKPAQEVLDVYKKALLDPDVKEETKRKIQLILDSEMLDKEEDRVDPKVEAKINLFIEEEIAKAVKRGVLPKGKKFRNLKDKIKKEKL